MTGRPTLVALAAVFIFAPVFAACTEDTTKYGDSNGLAGKHLPTPSSTATATPGGDGGMVMTGPGLADLCAGAGPLDGGACAVSWKTTIYPLYMSAAGTWKCADAACHGPGSATSPSISDDPLKAYLALATYVSPSFGGKPYVNACSVDPATSAISCNLLGSCLPIMPTTGVGVMGASPTAAENADIDKWLKCGAPFN